MYRQIQEVAVRLFRGDVIEVTDYRGRTWRATHEALTRIDGPRGERAAIGAYDVADTLVWWAATERIPSLWPAVAAVA